MAKITKKEREGLLKFLSFYENKLGSKDAAIEEIESLHITEMIFCDSEIVVKTGRPGKFIGVRGKNIDELHDWFGKPFHIIEVPIFIDNIIFLSEYDQSYNLEVFC